MFVCVQLWKYCLFVCISRFLLYCSSFFWFTLSTFSSVNKSKRVLVCIHSLCEHKCNCVCVCVPSGFLYIIYLLYWSIPCVTHFTLAWLLFATTTITVNSFIQTTLVHTIIYIYMFIIFLATFTLETRVYIYIGWSHASLCIHLCCYFF